MGQQCSLVNAPSMGSPATGILPLHPVLGHCVQSQTVRGLHTQSRPCSLTGGGGRCEHGCALLQARWDQPSEACMLRTAHSQSWECVALILAAASEQEKGRGRVTNLACLVVATSGRERGFQGGSIYPAGTRAEACPTSGLPSLFRHVSLSLTLLEPEGSCSL